MNDYEKISKEVLVSKSQIEKLNNENINFLISEAKKNRSKKIRLCSHESVCDPVHDMFIVHTKGTYVRPHRHINKAESILIL